MLWVAFETRLSSGHKATRHHLGFVFQCLNSLAELYRRAPTDTCAPLDHKNFESMMRDTTNYYRQVVMMNAGSPSLSSADPVSWDGSGFLPTIRVIAGSLFCSNSILSSLYYTIILELSVSGVIRREIGVSSVPFSSTFRVSHVRRLLLSASGGGPSAAPRHAHVYVSHAPTHSGLLTTSMRVSPMSTLRSAPQRLGRDPTGLNAAKTMLSSINEILSRPLVITVKCEKEDCASILHVEIPHSLEAAAPPRLVVRCAACASLLRVDLPEATYMSHKTAQLEMLRACQQRYLDLSHQSCFQASSSIEPETHVGTPEQQLATSNALQNEST